MIVKFFLARVLSWLASMKWDDFLRIVLAAQKAAAIWPKTSEMNDQQRANQNVKRLTSVNGFIEQAFPKLTGATLNVIRELAVAWFNRTAAK